MDQARVVELRPEPADGGLDRVPVCAAAGQRPQQLNGSVYKMIPAIFHGDATTGVNAVADPAAQKFQARRLSSALVGVAGAIGALGGVLVQTAFRQSFLSRGNGDAAYVGFIAYYALCAFVTWAVYVRTKDDALVGV